jgi:hypothetical protein
MNWQEEGRKWVGDDSPEAEATFHETLIRLRAERASNQKIAETVMRSPFVLALVWVVTAKKTLRAGKEARPPFAWEDQLARDPDLREEWRCETVRILGERLRTKGNSQKEERNAECDLDRPSIGGYWRVKIMYAAIKAAWNLHGEGRLKVRRGSASVQCYGDGMSCFDDKKLKEGPSDLRLDLIAAIGELENPRQRAVMQLSLLGCNYQEIADRLTTANGAGGAKVTYEMVRGAYERARAVLQKRLGVSVA